MRGCVASVCHGARGSVLLGGPTVASMGQEPGETVQSILPTQDPDLSPPFG